MGTDFLFGKMEKFWKWVMVMIVHYECTKCHGIVYFSMVKILKVFYHD